MFKDAKPGHCVIVSKVKSFPLYLSDMKDANGMRSWVHDTEQAMTFKRKDDADAILKEERKKRPKDKPMPGEIVTVAKQRGIVEKIIAAREAAKSAVKADQAEE